MSEKAKIINFAPSECQLQEATRVRLDSGRQVQFQSEGTDDLVEIRGVEGEMLLKVRLTEEGPVLSLSGAKLEMTSTESISLDAKKIHIRAEEQAVLESKGNLDLASSKDLEIRSEEDVKVTGKMLHLN